MELMSEGQWKRWEVVGRLRAGKLTMAQAALVLALSVRQVRRLRDRVATEGRRALRHRNTGRVPVHALGAGVRMRIVRVVPSSRTRYPATCTAPLLSFVSMRIASAGEAEQNTPTASTRT